MSDVEIRSYHPGDEQGIVEGYNQVFPTPDGRIKPRSLAHWKWKFLDNPTGLIHVAVADHPDAGIVGCYATLPTRLWIDGELALCGHVVDLFVIPEWRRHGGRPGLFVHTGRKHYQLWGGTGDGKNVFHYGWPVPAWRIGQRFLDYENIRDWDFLFRELGPARAAPADLEVRQVARYGADVDALWERMKPATGCAIVRDSAYLNWRYALAHDASYRLFECRERGSGRLRGLSVYTVSDFLFPHTAFLADWLLPPDDNDATVAMVATAEGQARGDGSPVLATLFPQQDPRFLEFQRLGFLVYGTSYFLVMARFDARATQYYREQWYHTAGDSDLI